MSLGKIVGVGSLATFGLLTAKEANAEIKDWQVEKKPNGVVVHVKRGDTFGEIGEHLNIENLEWHLKNGNIYYTDCENTFNPNIIEAGRDISFTREALPPGYGDVQIITDSKTQPEVPKSQNNQEYNQEILENDVNNSEKNKSDTSKSNPFINLGGGLVIPGGLDDQFGVGLTIADLSVGYEVSGASLEIGGKYSTWNGDLYGEYLRSIFGFSYKEDIEQGLLNVFDMYIQLMFKPFGKRMQIGGGYAVKNISDGELKAALGLTKGEYGKGSNNSLYHGPLGALRIMFPLPLEEDSEGIKIDPWIGLEYRYGEYKSDDIGKDDEDDKDIRVKDHSLELKLYIGF